MFNEETQEEALEMVVKAGFPVGRMLPHLGKGIFTNAVLSTKRDGQFWYGDLSHEECGSLQHVGWAIKSDIDVHTDDGLVLTIGS